MLATSDDHFLPALGVRISHAGSLGTVRFTGPVDDTLGLWLGIEWDNPSRGKHDGIRNGKRYFQCRLPGSGSFIRPSASISYGVSFLEALTNKYVDNLRDSPSHETVTLGSSQGAIQVEAVRLDKVRSKLGRLIALREVSLDQENVATCNKPGDIRDTCPAIHGLDLSQSLIPDWETVAKICAELTSLERLSLNHNRLMTLREHVAPTLPTTFMRLKELHLNGTLSSWNDMQQVIQFMPMLVGIEIGHNRIEALECGSQPTSQPAIESLNLDTNELTSWGETISALQSYTSLQRLILTSNALENIHTLEFGDKTFLLPSLRHLSLSFNYLRAWSDLDAIAECFPQLEILSVGGNPITRHAHARAFTIAKIPSLLRLDSANISAKERTDSELFYLSCFSSDDKASLDGLNIEHPRWKELCRKHAIAAVPAGNHSSQEKLKSRLIEIYLYRGDVPLSVSNILAPQLCEGNPSLISRVLPSMSLRSFKLKVSKSCHLGAKDNVNLGLIMANGQVVELKDNDTQQLAWWGIESGSKIVFVIN